MRLAPDVAARDGQALAASLVGRPVMDRPGGSRKVGVVTHASVDGCDIVADLALDEAWLPLELFGPSISAVNPLKQ